VPAALTSQRRGRSKTKLDGKAGAGRERAHKEESVSIWFRLLLCHALMLTELRRQLEDRITLARCERSPQASVAARRSA
jgi:hypothetical protein